MRRRLAVLLSLACLTSLVGCGQNRDDDMKSQSVEEPSFSASLETVEDNSAEETSMNITDEFVLIQGGTFQMGSPENEAWRSSDEIQHSVTVSDFYMSKYELTQKEYTAVMGINPSNFSGDDLPVENVSWLDAIDYCNARSEAEGLTPAYIVEGQNITWDKSADGYRLPTEAEWEYACRAGTTTPFYIAESPSAEQANYYGHYPYEIENNYFSQGNLTVQPGEYRQTTLPVGSFEANPNGLYDMYGNVGEWVWDYYGSYSTETQIDPSGAETGTLRVYRGGGWNDFAKNMRSAYRAAMEPEKSSFNLGIRLVRNAVVGTGNVVADISEKSENSGGKVLIAYFSWSGNTRGVAEEIARQIDADLFEITMVTPYSTDYNTVLEQAQADQSVQARPQLASHVENMEQYDVILLGYPNWWASIPMPVASFLEEYDFSNKTIIPFCSHGGGRFGQSLTAIAKLVPNVSMGDALSIHYSGGDTLSTDVTEWLKRNNLLKE